MTSLHTFSYYPFMSSMKKYDLLHQTGSNIFSIYQNLLTETRTSRGDCLGVVQNPLNHCPLEHAQVCRAFG